MKRVGVYVGAFDPIHSGHLDFARRALDLLNLDKVYFMVEPRPKNVQGVKAYTHRVNMVELMIRHESYLGNIVLQYPIAQREITSILSQRFEGHMVFILMRDDHISRTHNLAWLKHSFPNVVLGVGITRSSIIEIKNHLVQIGNITGSPIRFMSFMAPEPINQSKVKHELKLGKKPDAIPLQVYSYIKQEGLYISAPST